MFVISEAKINLDIARLYCEMFEKKSIYMLFETILCLCIFTQYIISSMVTIWLPSIVFQTPQNFATKNLLEQIDKRSFSLYYLMLVILFIQKNNKLDIRNIT